MYNLFLCSGWEETSFFGPCSICWLVLVILVYVALISRKQLGENLGIGYNLIGGLVGAILPALIIITVLGAAKWALLGGLIGSFIGGLGTGYFFESEGGGEW